MAPATEAELKTFLGITGADDFTAGIAMAVKDFIEAYTGRRWQDALDYDKPFVDSTDTVENDPLTTSATTILVTNADRLDGDGNMIFQVGQTLRINDELMLLVDIPNSGLDDELVVQRGAFGSMAAAGVQGDTIEIFDAPPDFDRWFYAQPPHVVQGGRRLIFHEDLAAGTFVSATVEGVTYGIDDVFVLRSPCGDAYGLDVMRFGTLHRWTSRGSYITVRGRWKTTCYADAIKQLSLELGQYYYMAGQSGSGGETLVASRQTGLVIAEGKIPERILQRLGTYRR